MVKRLTIIIILLIGYLSFDSIFMLYSQRLYQQVYHIQDAPCFKDQGFYAINVPVDESQKLTDVIEGLYQLSEQRKSSIIIVVTVPNEVSRSYMVTQCPIVSYLPVLESVDIDFSSRSERKYISSDDQDSLRSATFTYLGDNKDVESITDVVAPLHLVMEDVYLDSSVLFVRLISSQPEGDVAYLASKGIMTVGGISDGSGQYEDVGLINSSTQLLGYMLILLLLSYSVWLDQNKKEINILRLHGYSTIRAVRKVFLPIMIGHLLTLIMTFLILYMVKVSSVHPIALRFAGYLAVNLAVLLVGLLVIGGIFVIIIRRLSLVQSIKNMKIATAMIQINQLAKALMMIALMVPLLRGVEILVADVQSVRSLRLANEFYEDSYWYSGSLGNVEFDPQPSDIKKALVSDFEQKGYLYLQSKFIAPGMAITEIDANREILTRLTFMDTNGQPIDFSDKKNIVLIPSAMDINQINVMPGSTKVQYFNPIEIIDPQTLYINAGKSIKDPIITVVESNRIDSILNYYVPYKTPLEMESYLESIAQQAGYDIDVSGLWSNSIQAMFQENQRYLMDGILNTILRLLVLGAVMIMFILHHIVYYLSEGRKEDVVKTLLGYTLWEKHKNFLIQSVWMIWIPAIIIVLVYKLSWTATFLLTLLFLGFELLVSGLIIMRLQRRAVIADIKGERL